LQQAAAATFGSTQEMAVKNVFIPVIRFYLFRIGVLKSYK
jgi:hypothetical protein